MDEKLKKVLSTLFILLSVAAVICDRRYCRLHFFLCLNYPKIILK